MSRLPLSLSGGAVALPATPSAADQGWQFAGLYRPSATCIIGADGTGTAAFPSLDAGNRWQISRATISCGGTNDPQPSLDFYVVTGGHSATEGVLVSGTTCGLFDEVDYAGADGLVVLPGEQLLAVWAGATTGEGAVATVQYELWTQGN